MTNKQVQGQDGIQIKQKKWFKDIEKQYSNLYKTDEIQNQQIPEEENADAEGTIVQNNTDAIKSYVSETLKKMEERFP